MPTLTFYNLGNADTCRCDLADGRKLLVDYADMRTDEDGDKRVDLPKLLREDLNKAKRRYFDIVAFTHLDVDHYKGASDFFWFDHANKYQGDERIRIDTLWVPAAVITEDALMDEARVIQAEARYRLKNNKGIRVFSRPKKLEAWLNAQGLTLSERQHLITDAGQLVPGFDKTDAGGVEFFIHSPHAMRLNENEVEDRNGDCLVFQTRFCVDGYDTDVLLSGDSKHETWRDVVEITRFKGNEDRLHWDVYKLPHHCSYTAIGPDKSTAASPDRTPPTDQVAWLCETQSSQRCIIVSPSEPIPARGTVRDKNVQPPHREAANYYKDKVTGSKDGSFLVTMEEPSIGKPGPIVITIDGKGARKEITGSLGFAAITGTSSPRAGGI